MVCKTKCLPTFSKRDHFIDLNFVHVLIKLNNNGLTKYIEMVRCEDNRQVLSGSVGYEVDVPHSEKVKTFKW